MQILIRWSGKASLELKEPKEVREECCRQWKQSMQRPCGRSRLASY